jgi:GT2 family glycosyltransferase
MRATIVIAAHNEGDLLSKTVASVTESADELEHEIVVSDDASTDGSVNELRRKYPNVRVTGFSTRAGVSRTKDKGAQAAEGEVLVFLDGHCKPESGAIARLVEDVELAAGEAIVTPQICALDPSTWQNDMKRSGHGYGLDLETMDPIWCPLGHMTRHNLASGRFVYESPTFQGCAVAISRQLYQHMHGFDTDMLYWGCEDVDLGLQSWLLGHPILHDPEALIGHRFQDRFDHYIVPPDHLRANKLRMARRAFSDDTWQDWLPRFRSLQTRSTWESSWQAFTANRDSVESERTYLFAHRVHDEFWYSDRFALGWPRPELLGIGQVSNTFLSTEPDREMPSYTPDPKPSDKPSPSPLPSEPPPPTSPTPPPSSPPSPAP